MLKTFLFILSLSIYSLQASNLIKAEQALEKNLIDEAIQLYKLSAREGEDEANFQLGKIYYLKKYQKRDLDKAFEYFQKAADYHHLNAKYNLAMIYSQKKFKQHNYKKAYNLFLTLAQQDDPKSQYMVALYLLHGFGIDKDYKLAKKWVEKAYFVNNYKEASCGIALIYAQGFGVIQNFGRARKFSENLVDSFALCKKVFYDFKLYKKRYKEDKGFKFGYYK